MEELVIFAVVLEASLGGEIHFFYGVSTNLQAAQDRALENMHNEERQCGVFFCLVATHYTVL